MNNLDKNYILTENLIKYGSYSFEYLPVNLKNDRNFMMEKLFYNKKWNKNDYSIFIDLRNSKFPFFGDKQFMKDLLKNYKIRVNDPEYKYLYFENVSSNICYFFLKNEKILYKFICEFPEGLFYFFETIKTFFKLDKNLLPEKCIKLIHDEHFMKYYFKNKYKLRYINYLDVNQLSLNELFCPNDENILFFAIKYGFCSSSKTNSILENKIFKNLALKNMDRFKIENFSNLMKNSLYLIQYIKYSSKVIDCHFNKLIEKNKLYCILKYNTKRFGIILKLSKNVIYYNKYTKYVQFDVKELLKSHKKDNIDNCCIEDLLYILYKKINNSKFFGKFAFNIKNLNTIKFINIKKNNSFESLKQNVIHSLLYDRNYNNVQNKNMIFLLKNGRFKKFSKTNYPVLFKYLDFIENFHFYENKLNNTRSHLDLSYFLDLEISIKKYLKEKIMYYFEHVYLL